MNCPQCNETLIEPRGDTKYCEECGYPEENREPQPPCVKCGEMSTCEDGNRCLCDDCLDGQGGFRGEGDWDGM
jgi:hypothetical protein